MDAVRSLDKDYGKILYISIDKEYEELVNQFEDNKIRILSPNEIVNSNNLLQQLIQKFGGKGGGNPKSSQGFLRNIPKNLILEIEKLIRK